LIATFFAATEDLKEDGEIITIFPKELNNSAHDINGFPLPQSKILKFMANEPLHNNPKELADELRLDSVPEYPIAFYPTLSLPRMTAQLSVFTIHPGYRTGFNIDDVLKDKKYICKYIIPQGLKKRFEQNLSYLGISNRTLFPDLEGLSKAFQKEESFYTWDQPDNPPFIKQK
jgi:hypothetical protein